MYDTIGQISKNLCCWSSIFMNAYQFSHSGMAAFAEMLENMVATDGEKQFHYNEKSDFHLFHLLNIFYLYTINSVNQ